MDKEQALEGFFKELKKTFNITALFTRDHPSFIKAIEVFNTNLQPLFNILNPLKFGITPEALLVGKKYYSGEIVYTELAKMFHLRKLKTIEIQPEVTLGELAIFFDRVAKPAKEVLAAGGVITILHQEKVTHILVEEIDYSQLLKGKGTECKDVWVYLLGEASAKQDPTQASALADNFGQVLSRCNIKELLEDEEACLNISKFLDYLKDTAHAKFGQCSTQLASSLLRSKDVASLMDIHRVKSFFRDLKESDYAKVLSDGLLSEEGVDPLSFGLFSKLLAEGQHESVVSQAVENIRKSSSCDGRKLSRNIERLFSMPQGGTVSQVYEKTLTSLLKDVSFTQALIFDQEGARRNYWFLLLNLFSYEKTVHNLNAISVQFDAELDAIINKNEIDLLASFIEVLKHQEVIRPSLKTSFEPMKQKVYHFVEESVFKEQSLPKELKQLGDAIQKSSLTPEFYLEKIFDENRVYPGVLRLFFKLFPQDISTFSHNLERRMHDVEFVHKVIEGAKGAGDLIALGVLKTIYSFSTTFIKTEVLRAMQALNERDSLFLLSIIKEADPVLKKEALRALRNDEEGIRQALGILFSMRSPWGSKNRLLLENILVVEEVGLRVAQDHLIALSKRPFFWNRAVRKAALEVLAKWQT